MKGLERDAPEKTGGPETEQSNHVSRPTRTSGYDLTKQITALIYAGQTL